jgi:hypothetical protein
VRKNVLFTEGQKPKPVSVRNPLVGLEEQVLDVWLRNSPSLRVRYRKSAQHRDNIENAARLAVWEAFAQELDLRSQGLSPEEAQEFTRPAMWTPPTWSTPKRDRRSR